MGSKRPVWVSVGKTHHQAWLLEGVDEPHVAQAINHRRNDEQVLIQWESVRYTEWVPRSSVHFDIPSERRRPAKKSETRCRSNTQQSDFAVTKNPDYFLQHSDMVTFICPHRPQPTKTPLAQGNAFFSAPGDGTVYKDETLIAKILEFSGVIHQSDGNSTTYSPKQMQSSCQLRNWVTTANAHESTVTPHELEETQISTTVTSNTACTAKDFRKENHIEKNIHKSRQNIKFKSKHKSFTLRDLEQDGNFTETQIRVFNELLTGKTLFSPPSLKKVKRKTKTKVILPAR